MAQVIARFEGTDKVVDNLKSMQRRVLTKGLKESLLAAAEIIRVEAYQRAPVHTGKLAGSMVAEWDPQHHYAVVGPSKIAFYGEFLEYGTSKMAAKPFLRPALDARREDAFHAMQEHLTPIVEGA